MGVILTGFGHILLILVGVGAVGDGGIIGVFSSLRVPNVSGGVVDLGAAAAVRAAARGAPTGEEGAGGS